MKAALLTAYGDTPFEIADVITPEPGPGEVLIRIAVSALNPFDQILRAGYMAAMIPLKLPAILGSDAAGTVTKVGPDVTAFTPGDRVIADFAPNGLGAQAEYGVVPVSAIAYLPDNLDFAQGATLPKAGLTGRQAVESLNVRAGDRVLVSGALGAVGRAAIQYLRELGAVPVAGVRQERLAEGRALAHEAVNINAVPGSADFSYAISAAAPVVNNTLAHVRDGGKVTSIVPVLEGANADGRVHLQELYHRTDAATLLAVAHVAARGDLVIPIAARFPLDQINDAYAALATGASGKIILQH